MLTVAYGEATLDRSNVYQWYKMFSEGREDVNDEERAGRPSTSTTDEKINEGVHDCSGIPKCFNCSQHPKYRSKTLSHRANSEECPFVIDLTISNRNSISLLKNWNTSIMTDTSDHVTITYEIVSKDNSHINGYKSTWKFSETDANWNAFYDKFSSPELLSLVDETNQIKNSESVDRAVLKLTDIISEAAYASLKLKSTINKNKVKFKWHKSTITAMKELTETILEHKQRELTALIAVDLSGAFDNAWWPAIIKRMDLDNVPSSLIQII
ncbi:hypothetical protein LAZ67_3001807 [Cordylochernes scorpioides]|uniref:Reverse transcriptase domain-containing protein n=1 Tax=Cordylochernes scorpioides TaxID=51811 RepID=A0ABY6K871_9ARAC|nr:hypothetical protein LAZ67_3001807 [Cordylochernes scorpioides]